MPYKVKSFFYFGGKKFTILNVLKLYLMDKVK